MRLNFKIHVRNEHCGIKNAFKDWVPVAHSCNASYSGDRDEEDYSLKPDGANISVRPYIKKIPSHTIKKKGWWSGGSYYFIIYVTHVILGRTW
jgi:hypothetical protein